MYQHILIALEGKSTDEAVIAHTTNLAQKIGARVTLLQVITVAADGPGGLGKQFQTELGSRGWQRKQRAVETLAKLEKRLQLEGLIVKTALVIGDRGEADEIVAFADEGNYDLIVMAADGRPRWQRALFGGPADGVHHNATVPTLFVSDGTRRARVITREAPPVNTVMAALGSPSI